MNKKIMMAAVLYASLSGCATHYTVAPNASVYGQHCREIGIETCQNGCTPFMVGDRFVALKANNITETFYGDRQIGSVKYFHCGPEEPLYLVKSSEVSIYKNEINPAATAIDLKQATAECDYEAHKATIDTGRPAPARAYIPSNNYQVNRAQLDAIHDDDMQKSYHETKLSFAKQELTKECLKIRGFVLAKSKDSKDIQDFYKYCPDLDGYTATCFIPGVQK
jgi:hypothetical protein